jgi:superfamily II DNA/RNA helicase
VRGSRAVGSGNAGSDGSGSPRPGGGRGHRDRRPEKVDLQGRPIRDGQGKGNNRKRRPSGAAGHSERTQDGQRGRQGQQQGRRQNRRNGDQQGRPKNNQQPRTRNPEVSQVRAQRPAPESPGPATGVDTSVRFSGMGLPTPVVNELTHQGLVHPFPIQAAAIPDGLAGRDVLGRGPTGSGKTFTFGLPVISRLVGGSSKPGHPRAAVLVPTRELAQQVADRLRPLAEAVGQRVIEVVGGVNIKRNFTALARPVDILVATPGRAEDLIGQKALFLDRVEIVALDEADQMADMGFLPQVRRLLDRMPSDAQHLFFSATLDGDIKVLIDQYMNDPVTHSTGEVTAKVGSMDHYLGVVPDKPFRNEVVLELGRVSTKTIMFMRTKHTVDRQVKKLVRDGTPAVGLHGDKGQGARTRAIREFTDGTATVLVATDIAARGIDIKGVDLVVHIDPPAEHKAYVHRAGRTARAGEKGTVLTLTLEDQKKDTVAMMRKAGVTPTEWNLDDPRNRQGIRRHFGELGLTEGR